MTARAVAFLIIAAGIMLLAFVPGHWAGRRSRRFDWLNGWDAGVAAEQERWEEVTGATRGRLARERTEDMPDVPGNDGWPYGFHVKEEPPPAEVLLAEADAVLGKPRAPGVPTVAEIDEMAAAYNAANSRAPVVADITDAARWRPFEDETPTITGVVVGSPQDHTGPEWLDTQMAAMDSETAAYLRRIEAEMASFRRGLS